MRMIAQALTRDCKKYIETGYYSRISYDKLQMTNDLFSTNTFTINGLGRYKK